MPNYSGIWTEQAVMQAVGAGNWPGNPGAPTIGTATGGDASASVTFTAPTNTGQSAITSYTVTSSPGGLTGTGASSPVTVSGLTNGTAYTFTVTATNATGTGPASAASNSVTPAAPVYIEDVYSTYLYTGTGATLTITNGIDLSSNGGLTWFKQRNAARDHVLEDTVRGAGNALFSNYTNAQASAFGGVSSYGTTGFTLDGNASEVNANTGTYVSWTFREQPKFFDIVTYTGDGIAGRTVAHNLGSVPGCIIVKLTSSSQDWRVYHRSLGATKYLSLNDTSAAGTLSTIWNDTEPTSSVFSVGTNSSVNNSGSTYVAYLFAHDAGGFGAAGTDNVISCGSFTANGSGGCSVTLGYEPQWIMYKNTAADGWRMGDVMRGWSQTQWQYLAPNDANVDTSLNNNPSYLAPTSTGFNTPTPGLFTAGNTFVYIAIRRGPMAVPTDATKVFSPVTRAGTSAVATVTTSFPPDSALIKNRAGNSTSVDWSFNFFDKLRNPGWRLSTAFTDAQDTTLTFITSFNQDGITFNSPGYTATNGDSYTYINYFFRRAPSYFDEVVITNSPTTYNHNLTVTPELIIIKCTSAAGANWVVYSKSVPSPTTTYLNFNNTNAVQPYGAGAWSVSSTQFSVDSGLWANGTTGFAYLFATAPGVSKVGTYTGTGTTQAIDCGFTAGSRFVMIKRTDSTGAWYVWDSARGIIGGNDPYLLINDTAAEVTNTDYVDTSAAGFEISSTAPAAINANGGTFIFLAIA